MSIYLDSSALVKLVVEEAESDALRRYLRASAGSMPDGAWGVATSRVATVELPRAIARHAIEVSRQLIAVLDALTIVELDRAVAAAAAALGPPELRSLDAIHLASAQDIGPELTAFVTYDARLEEAARHARLPVEVPR